MSNPIKLTKLQREILCFFGQNSFGRNFYWTGGTLLAYQYLRHRRSIDLDFFSKDLFDDNDYLIFTKQLRKEIKAEKIILTEQHNRRLYLIKRGRETVKLELVFFPFPAVAKRKKSKEFSLKIDSLTDIMVNKILSAYQRKEPKDIFDLYCYLNQEPQNNFFKLVRLVEKKFGITIEPSLLLAKINELSSGLAVISPLILSAPKNLNQKVKNFFQNIFNDLAKKRIK